MNEIYWKQIWERKGELETNDLKELDGYEATTINPEEVANKIIKILKIKKSDKVLEIGCGAGMIAQYFDCDYVGIDYSKSLVKKHIELLKHSVLMAKGNDIPFKDKYFDKAFAYSVFHYFPDKEYVEKVIKELKRVCKGKIFIGDLTERSHRREHLVFRRSEFQGMFSKGFYNKDRFNVLIDTEPIIKRNILLTPGPATTTDFVKYAQVVPDICPREREFGEIMRQIREDLVKIVKGDGNYTSILFAGSGTAMMDACINSVVPPDKKIAVINNGAYGIRMVKITKSYRISCVELSFEWGEMPNLGKVRETLEKDKNIACLAMVHHETTTGMLNPIKEIGNIAKENNCIFIVDTVSSFAGIPINIKDYKIDFMFSTSNKCIQGTAGLAFVICRKDELEKTKNYPPRSFYLNLYQQYDYFEKKGQMQFTPPVQVIHALRQATEEYFEEGGENRYNRYTKSWQTLRKGLKEIGFKFLLKEEKESHILTTILEPENPNYDFSKLHDLLYEEGFTIYPGKIGKKGTFRLANMGAIDYRDIKDFIVILKRILHKMGVKFKEGKDRSNKDS